MKGRDPLALQNEKSSSFHISNRHGRSSGIASNDRVSSHNVGARTRMDTAMELSLAGMISGSASRRIVELAMAELIADKFPFTPSRLKMAPLAARIVSGAICGAAIHIARRRTLSTGALVGGLAAISAAVAGYQVRRKLGRDLPDLVLAVLEDVLATGGGLIIAGLAAPLE